MKFISSGDNITQYNSNFTTPNTKYWWSVNVSDGCNWTNETYHFTTTSVTKSIISKGKDAYKIEMSYDGSTLNGYVNDTIVTSSIDTNWHYVTLTYDGSSLNLYTDGELVSSTSLTGDIPTNDNYTAIGEALTGTLDELRISDTARSPEWININFNMMNSPSNFITVEPEQDQSYTYLNTTINNTGDINIKTDKLTVLINGTLTDSIYLQPYLYPQKETEVFTRVQAGGAKRIKLITKYGISVYEIHT